MLRGVSWRSIIFALGLIILLLGCSPTQEFTVTPERTLASTDSDLPAATETSFPSPEAPTSTPEPVEPPEHRIGVRLVDGTGEFYDRKTGERFVPRGNNYTRLGPQTHPSGSTQIYHATFDPGVYDAAQTEAVFQEMHDLGYNTVRVFVSQNTIGTDRGLDPAYMDNVIDFLELAEEYRLYVIVTQDWLPGGRYGRILSQDCCEQFNMMNVHFLTQAGLEANTAYFQDFVGYLIEHGAPLEVVLSYQLRNELYFNMDFPPFSFEKGAVQGLNGKNYDMGDPAQKRQMMDDNLVLWLDRIRDAILELDPTALVSVGFFWPQEPNPARIGDPRFINTAPVIRETDLDFIDLHAYPAAELTLQEYVENFGMAGMEEKPVIMGEFGVATADVASVDEAAQALMEWQADSCSYGFDGWLLWSWDIRHNNDFYNAVNDDAQIGRALAPALRPDPCQTVDFDFIQTNLARDKEIRVSAFLPDEPPENAVDGTGEQWGAGAGPPQWIEINLGKSFSVKEIRLTVSQYPEGETTHQIYARGPGQDLQLVHTFQGFTKDKQVLVFEPESPLRDVQYIRVQTVSSPSWVAWKEIEVIQAPE